MSICHPLYKRLQYYAYLMRLDKPVGTLLLLWPTLWALWLASMGHPNVKILWIFIWGVFCMRSLGCIFNDYADRHFDCYVKRTRKRPLASGKVSTFEAFSLASLLCLIALLLVLQCNKLTILLSFIGLGCALCYPFLKRVTHLPQLGLGIAFSWSIPMAFAAETNQIPPSAWLLFLASTLWPIIYDTIYAMMDREDDIKIGIKSTAILFGASFKGILTSLQIAFLSLFSLVGALFHLNIFFYLSLVGAACLFVYQQTLIKQQTTQHYLAAFRNNNWVGCSLFIGIVLSLL